MFGLGFTEILIILVVALIVLGPKQLPKVARTLGRSLGEFKRTADDFRREMSVAVDLDEQPKRSLTTSSVSKLKSESSPKEEKLEEESA